MVRRLAESAGLLHDFAVAMMTLQPSPDDLILDLGAGGGWCSDLLSRLNRKSVAVDISVDMLRAAHARPAVDISGVAADLEQLPFRSAVFQKAVCLNAIHHVPDIPKAIGEIARVLTSDGMVVFSEPGQGHADAAVSNAAVHDYGVLEQDILVGPFMEACLAAGFEDVTLQPLSHVVPDFVLSLPQWRAWAHLADSRRPRRALAKIAFGLLELVGLGKRGPLFEEALAMSMVRTLRQVAVHHPIIVARKSKPSVVGGMPWKATLDAEVDDEVLRGQSISLRITVTNAGTRVWRPQTPSGIGIVNVGIQLLGADGRMLTRDHHRAQLPHAIHPGQVMAESTVCAAPLEPGDYFLKFDMVAEGVTWFEMAGSSPLIKPFRVT